MCSERNAFSLEIAVRTDRKASRTRVRNRTVIRKTGGSVARVTKASRGLSRNSATITPIIVLKSFRMEVRTSVNISLIVSTSLVTRETRRPTGLRSR